MPPSPQALLVRFGIWLLPLSALLALEGTLTHQPDQTKHFKLYAAYVSAPRFRVEQLVSSIGGTALGIIGIVALFLYLMNRGGGLTAASGLVTGLLGYALLLPIFGVAAFSTPAIGSAYLHGHTGVPSVNAAIYGKPLVVAALVAGLFYSAGWILFGVSLNGLRVVPRWAAIALAGAGPLISLVGLLVWQVQTVGTLLLLIGTGWVAWAVWRQLAPVPRAAARPIWESAPPVRAAYAADADGDAVERVRRTTSESRRSASLSARLRKLPDRPR